MATSAAIFVCVLLSGLAVFQVALALGAPIGRFAWGGEHRVLPARLRVGSAVSTALYVVFGAVVLDRVGLISVVPDPTAQIGVWVIAAVFLLAAIPNLISRSKPERYLMAPLTLVLSGLSAAVALAS